MARVWADFTVGFAYCLGGSMKGLISLRSHTIKITQKPHDSEIIVHADFKSKEFCNEYFRGASEEEEKEELYSLL